MIELLAAADTHWSWTLFGRFHPLTVHFPIALILVAAVLEVWALLKKKPAAEQAAWICTWMGAVSTILSTVMGYAFADKKGESHDLTMHERFGLVTCVVATIATALAWRARKAGGRGGPAMAYRAFLLVAALAVSVTGHYGGVMNWGDWLNDDMPWAPKEAPPLQKAPEAPTPAAVPGSVDFVKDIAPIIKASCLKCHGPAPHKTKGKLRLDTRELAMKGGSGGKVILPGKPADSSFYTLLISTDEDERMPEKADPLPKEQTELIRKWIEQGAPWPDGVEIK